MVLEEAVKEKPLNTHDLVTAQEAYSYSEDTSTTVNNQGSVYLYDQERALVK